MLELLEYEDAGGLTHDEPVSLGVERAARPLRILVPPGECPHRAEAGDADLRDPGLRPTGEHHLGPPEPDLLHGSTDRHVPGGAGRALGAERSSRPELHRDPGGAHVRDDRRNRERADTIGAADHQGLVAVLEALQTSDSGCHRRSDALGLGLDRDPRVLLRHARSREDHLRETVHPPRLARVDPLGRIEILQLAGEVHAVVGRVEQRDRTSAALPRDEVLPERLSIVSERRHCAEPGDDDPRPPVVRAHPTPPTSRGRRPPGAPLP